MDFLKHNFLQDKRLYKLNINYLTHELIENETETINESKRKKS